MSVNNLTSEAKEDTKPAVAEVKAPPIKIDEPSKEDKPKIKELQKERSNQAKTKKVVVKGGSKTLNKLLKRNKLPEQKSKSKSKRLKLSGNEKVIYGSLTALILGGILLSQRKSITPSLVTNMPRNVESSPPDPPAILNSNTVQSKLNATPIKWP